MMLRRIVLATGILFALMLGAGASAFGGDSYATGSGPAVAGESGASEGLDAPPDAASAPPSAVPVPTTSAPTGAGPAPVAGSAPATAPPSCPTGEKQAEVETALAQLRTYGPVSVDGVADEADCQAVKKFQQRFGISPAAGLAGPTTADVAKRIAASSTAAEQAKCGAAPTGLTACVDLTQQTVWVVRDGAVVWGPTVTRTGKSGYATPAGTFHITNRNPREWSIKYKVWLPYWQHFTDGMGFHETTTYIHNSGIGSHGCVNLLHDDAKALWGLIGNGTTVKLFGRRAGT